MQWEFAANNSHLLICTVIDANMKTTSKIYGSCIDITTIYRWIGVPEIWWKGFVFEIIIISLN